VAAQGLDRLEPPWAVSCLRKSSSVVRVSAAYNGGPVAAQVCNRRRARPTRRSAPILLPRSACVMLTHS
jgi:hypothetical protein